MTSPDDPSLLAAHLAGDPEAFGELVRRHRDRLWAVALRTAGDRETAADALQEALLSAYRRADSFRGDAQVSTWLHRIVVNACLDKLRQDRSRPTDPLPDEEDRVGVLADRAPYDDPAEASERRADVLNALNTLSEDQRVALVLVDMEGFSVDEVAELVGCASGTVKSRCARGRARLAPLLRQYRRNPDAPTGVQPPDSGASSDAQCPGGPPRRSAPSLTEPESQP